VRKKETVNDLYLQITKIVNSIAGPSIEPSIKEDVIQDTMLFCEKTKLLHRINDGGPFSFSHIKKFISVRIVNYLSITEQSNSTIIRNRGNRTKNKFIYHTFEIEDFNTPITGSFENSVINMVFCEEMEEGLNAEYRKIVRMYYFDNLNLSQISRKFGCSKQNIHIKLKKAVSVMRMSACASN
jgi:RNA polymerase sigma factor (sigma-70 family)